MAKRKREYTLVVEAPEIVEGVGYMMVIAPPVPSGTADEVSGKPKPDGKKK